MTKILIAEDDEDSLDMLSRRLTLQGFDIVTAKTGSEAVAMAERDMPDVIVMDLNMPGMTGWEAARAIKASPATAKIRIIALSAHATSGDHDEAYQAGCDAFESKPVDLNRLMKRIREVLGGE